MGRSMRPGPAEGEPVQAGNFTLLPLPLDGPKLIAPRRFGDHRGFFLETYSARDFAALGIGDAFVQDNHSLSAEPGTVRGLHFQRPPTAQAKLVRVLRGAILDVAVDIRRASPTYGRHVAVELSAATAHLFYVPVGFAHGFCTLTPETEVTYKVTGFYAPQDEFTVLWNDPDLGIPWPVAPDAARLSEKDRSAPRLRDLPAVF